MQPQASILSAFTENRIRKPQNRCRKPQFLGESAFWHRRSSWKPHTNSEHFGAQAHAAGLFEPQIMPHAYPRSFHGHLRSQRLRMSSTAPMRHADLGRQQQLRSLADQLCENSRCNRRRAADGRQAGQQAYWCRAAGVWTWSSRRAAWETAPRSRCWYSPLVLYKNQNAEQQVELCRRADRWSY